MLWYGFVIVFVFLMRDMLGDSDNCNLFMLQMSFMVNMSPSNLFLIPSWNPHFSSSSSLDNLRFGT